MADWRDDALCRADPDRWFARTERTNVMHICRSHCPVVEQCLRAALEHPPADAVQGGVAFNGNGGLYPAWYYKPPASCPACPESPPSDTGACGTYVGYQLHLARRQRPCSACLDAAAQRRLRTRSNSRRPA